MNPRNYKDHPFHRLICLMRWSVAVVTGFCVVLSIARAGEPMNVLLICVDDLRPELACYGKEYIHSPNIDSLAASGCLFERHFVQAPTCGASRYAMLTGCYGASGNDALFKRAERFRKSGKLKPNSLPGWFRRHGYETVAIGKVSHHPGGLGGSDWDDVNVEEMPDEWSRQIMPSGEWLHPRGAMHGLANGEIRNRSSSMDVMQSLAGDDQLYPDGRITQSAVDQLESLADGSKPFLLAVGLIRPHLPFGSPAKYMDHYVDVSLPPIPNPAKPSGRSTWHRSGEFMQYNRWGRDPRTDEEFATAVRKHYAACVSYADAQVGRILEKLDSLRLKENTVVVLWGDHGWHLGERNVWGKHTLFDESLHSPLIVRAPGRTTAGSRSGAIVETIDLLPTLCELADLAVPSGIDGASLVPNLRTPEASGGQAISYWGGKQAIYSMRTSQHRLVKHSDGYCELYDYTDNQSGHQNVAAEQAEVVERLETQLQTSLDAIADDGDER